MAQSFEQLQQEIIDRAKDEIKQARHDYDQGMNDCKNGIYDKWFRYHRKDDGRAYDLGWVFQNQTTQNETVKFIRG
jgi:hypothetical protein